MSIKAGDLVIVEKPRLCCGNSDSVGYVFRVKAPISRFAFCLDCGFSTDDISSFFGTPDGANVEIPRLKKIDPPSTGELDRVPVRMKEPA